MKPGSEEQAEGTIRKSKISDYSAAASVLVAAAAILVQGLLAVSQQRDAARVTQVQEMNPFLTKALTVSDEVDRLDGLVQQFIRNPKQPSKASIQKTHDLVESHLQDLLNAFIGRVFPVSGKLRNAAADWVYDMSNHLNSIDDLINGQGPVTGFAVIGAHHKYLSLRNECQDELGIP